MKNVRVEWQAARNGGTKPTRTRDTDAGYDLYAVEDCVLVPGCVEHVPLGVSVSVPQGFYYTIDGRSSLNSKGIIVIRAIIDATYTGELYAVMANVSITRHIVNAGDRVAQMTIHEQICGDFVEVESWGAGYQMRGDAGWGSSGS